MTYKTETRTVYVTEDGVAHETPAHAERHTLRQKLRTFLGSKESMEEVIAPLAFSRATRDLVRQFIATYDEPQVPKADADGWIEWKGGEYPPIERKKGIFVRFGNGEIEGPLSSGAWIWSWDEDGAGEDIVAYRVISD